ncbi:MAG: hypothetical protein HON90_03750 [Halobacteriovoraceae bacterium]|jgi:hypothetical protein|nr:hypothetical protein [Halobacteriovoraceae bacterium]
MTNEIKITKSKCNQCLQETKHDIQAVHIQKGSEEIDNSHGIVIDWSYTWEILECRGCENVSVKMSHYFSEADGIEVKYYPPTSSKRKPRWIDDLNDEILKNLFNELYIAHGAGAKYLTTTACRTIIDQIMNLKIGNEGGFQQRLKRLVSEGEVSAADSKLIDVALEAGHASAHRGWNPKETIMMDTVIGIVENLAERLFILPELSDNLKKEIPKREK